MFHVNFIVASGQRLGVERRPSRYPSVGSPPPIYNVFDQVKKDASERAVSTNVIPDRPLTPNLGATRRNHFKPRGKSTSELVRDTCEVSPEVVSL